MTVDDATYQASVKNRASDLLPSCTRCGDLSPPGEKRCITCGTWIAFDGPRSHDLRSHARRKYREELLAGHTPEAVPPTNGEDAAP